ncbi:MAG: serine--tRNA ligase [Oscillospiraceae bacterium]|nr:serine--tRNA ligase [Oscillospiraceae bacterium]
MLDIRRIRENKDEVIAAVNRRGTDYTQAIEDVLKVDEERRNLASKIDALKAEQNKDSKLIPQYKKEGKDTTELMAEMKKLADEIKEGAAEVSRLEKLQEDMLLMIPNTPDATVPDGKDDSDNVELRRWGEPTKFDFEPKAHWDLGKELDILDPERAAKVTGARFHFYKGLGSRLERAVLNFYLDLHTTEHGYTEMFPPFIANADSMRGPGQLPKFGEDMFKVEGKDWYLIPTAEVPVTNYHRDEILDGTKLPFKYAAYSGCFRAEAGSAGRDTRGLIRQHEFNKVEMVKFARPDQSWDELETLTWNAEHALQLLGLPHRVIALCAGDMGFSSAKTYDVEVWMPSYNSYKEISSCSNFTDYQARRMQIRYKNNPKDKAELIHTLNGSGLAIGRTTAAIIENYQNEDGSITVPEVLVPYMRGVTKIEKNEL